jgi:hypothetical protein
MINWKYYPTSEWPPDIVLEVVDVFKKKIGKIDSHSKKLHSNEVLALLRPGLEDLEFGVEKGKCKDEKIHVPVLFGLNGRTEKSFDADAYNEEHGMVIEVEAGRAYSNYQFLKDLFQACTMHNVNYLAIAVRNIYKNSKDFEKIARFFDTMYASQRLELPLKGICIIGY